MAASGEPGPGDPLLRALAWRCIGPFRGGRVVAVAGDPADPAVFYFGACAGGVWKTVDGGAYWENVSDRYFRTAAVGALAVAESDPGVVYAGMGEACIRVDVSHGDGVYRSTDGGRTWRHLGLSDTRHIGRVRVHPQDPDLVYVAALGHAFGPNAERGVFRSRDGGRSWQRVLHVSERAGAVDLGMARTNPRVLFAGCWEVVRRPWALESGGPGSGLWRSTDGGDTWEDLSARPGLPRGLKGRIGVAVSPARAERVWAVVEAQDGGLFRSDDGGETWTMASEDRQLRGRPWYYCHVVADPQDADTVWVLNYKVWKSTDAGRSFTQVVTPHGDNHDLWIDPRDPRRMVQGNDGGACVSFNGGASWSTIYNQPTAQFYHVTTDTRVPYRVYGTQQDNSAISVPSRSYKGAICMSDCYPVGSSESGWIAVRPDDPDVVYSGAVGSAPGGGGVLLRYDHRTGQCRMITVWPELYFGWAPRDLRYRFQWTFPIVISPHDPGTLYAAGNVIFRSRDEGASWEPISPDLTRNDPERLGASGGPITPDTTGAEHYCTVYALAESTLAPGLLWAGTDDGLVHLSRDAGKTWTRITPPDLPEWATVTCIEASRHAPGRAYLCATRYKLADTRPYLWKTQDYGATWERITGGLPADDFTRVIREDPVRPGLLYAGTETGVSVSWDDGASWQRLQLNLPAVPVYDLAVKDGDLVAATHGRAFWILDDLTVLREAGDAVRDAAVHLFTPRAATYLIPPINSATPTGPGKNYLMALGYPATFTEARSETGELIRTFLDAGTNPPNGLVLYYALTEAPQGEVTLRFTGAAGRLIREISSAQAGNDAGQAPAGQGGQAAAGAAPAAPAGNAGGEPRPGKAPGLNRFVWNLRHAPARGVTPPDPLTERSLAGPVVPPGRYRVELSVDGRTVTAEFEVRRDPAVTAPQADLDAACAFLLQVRDRLSEVHDAVNQIREVRRQVEEWVRRARGHPAEAEIAAAAAALGERLGAVEQELIEPRARVDGDRIVYPARLNAKLAAVTSVVASADFAPTRQVREVFEGLSHQAGEVLGRWRALQAGEVAAFSALVRSRDVPPVVAFPAP